jgi:ParB family chromosome partitioning protein
MTRGIDHAQKRSRDERRTAVGELLDCYLADAGRKRDIVNLARERAASLRSIANALRRLGDDDIFLSILEREGLDTVPLPLSSRLGLWGRSRS